MTEIIKCKATVYPQGRFGSFHPHSCSKPIWKDGYCKIHHPESVEERNKKSRERWDAKFLNSPTAKLTEALKEIERLKKIIVGLGGIYE